MDERDDKGDAETGLNISPDEDSADYPPETLYHYTNQQGLLGIISSQVLYATKIQYFNDSADFHLTLDLAKAVLQDRIEHGLTEDAATHLQKEVDGIRQANIFAISLSELPDLLSQWRAYGAPGSSFAIGLDTATLAAIAEAIRWTLHECTYQPSQHRRIVGAAVADALREESDTQQRKTLRNLLFTVAPVNKHFSFEEEQEWRVVSPPLPEEFGFELRPGRFTPVPYVTLPLLTTDGVSAIREVIVGPTPHRDLAIMAAATLLRREGIDVPIKSSQTTFREW